MPVTRTQLKAPIESCSRAARQARRLCERGLGKASVQAATAAAGGGWTHLRGVDSDDDPARFRSLVPCGGRAAAPLSLRRGPQLPDRVPLRGCCRWPRGALPAARCPRLLQAWPALLQRGSRSVVKPAAVRPRDVHGGLHRCRESEGTGGEGSRRLGSPAAVPPRAAPQSVI